MSEALSLGYVNAVLQPTVDKAGSLSSDLAPIIVGARFSLVLLLPLKPELVATYTAYLDAHKVDKPDIWPARDVELPPSARLHARRRRDLGQWRRQQALRGADGQRRDRQACADRLRQVQQPGDDGACPDPG